MLDIDRSHLTQVRGLKPHELIDIPQFEVAPHAGAWIETPPSSYANTASRSHLTQVRGLKPAPTLRRLDPHLVAPHAGAWIETGNKLPAKEYNRVAPHAGAWIETLICSLVNVAASVAPHAGAWIET